MALHARIAALKPETWAACPLDLDVGEAADGYHLIARSISLSENYLLFEFAFVPEPAAGAGLWLNTCYGSDFPVSWNYVGAGDDVQYERLRRRPGTRGSTSSGPTASGWTTSTAAGSPIATTCGTGYPGSPLTSRTGRRRSRREQPVG